MSARVFLTLDIREEVVTEPLISGRATLDEKSMPFLHSVLKGRKKQKPPQKGAKTLDQSALREYFVHLPPNIYDNQVWRTIFALMNNTIRRASDITLEHQCGLKMGDCKWEGTQLRPQQHHKFMIITINKSKTNQYKQAQDIIVTCICPNI